MSTITATPTKLPTGTWSIDPVHSQVGFAVEYMVGTFRGSFSPVEGTLAVAEDGAAELKGSAQAAGIKVQDENLSTHLLSPDFFDAERTPEIGFSATDVRRDGDDVTVNGELTIKGITQPVELTGTVTDPVERRLWQRPHRSDPQHHHRPHATSASPGTCRCRTASRRSRTT